MSDKIRKVDDNDMKLIFEWSNEELCRENSFSSEKIKWEEHILWFKKKMEDNNCVMFIYEYENVPVGQIRVDISKTVGEISYSVSREYRGKSYGYRMIAMLETEESVKNRVDVLVGKVKCKNMASKKIFEKLHYMKKEQDEYIFFYKKIN